MKTTLKAGLKVVTGLLLVVAAAAYIHTHNLAVLNPKGIIAARERNLMLTAFLLMLIVVVPVFVLLIVILVRYRETNVKAKYTPEWDHHMGLEALWWGLPLAIIVTLSVVTWRSTHQLDPFKPLASTVPAETIQVVALDWKWLFIYPKEHIATVNYLMIPNNVPINFDITADAPMNSFWIPQLGGQIYAMPGMETQLHLMADTTGNYAGSSANISGVGFAGMKFMTHAVEPVDFYLWTKKMATGHEALTSDEYATLALPSANVPPADYASVDPDLYNKVMIKYMLPAGSQGTMGGMGPVTGTTTP